MMRTRTLRLLLVVCAVGATGAAGVQGAAGGHASASGLEAKLAKALASPYVDARRTGALAVDLRTGQVVFQHNAARALVPASTEKLTVSFAALKLLGPSFRFRTEVLGAGQARRRPVARQSLSRRPRRSDARHRRRRPSRPRRQGRGHPPRDRQRHRGRAPLRRAPRCPGLEVVLPRHRVAAALRSRRRRRAPHGSEQLGNASRRQRSRWRWRAAESRSRRPRVPDASPASRSRSQSTTRRGSACSSSR